MIYTEMTRSAMIIAYDAHHGQTDKAGMPYIFHPLHLAEQMPDEETTTLALLHDVVEDTGVTFEDLIAQGISAPVIEALKLLTHEPTVDYFDYVRALKSNSLAKAVKLADLKHNSDATRVLETSPKMETRFEKYAKAIRILEEP